VQVKALLNTNSIYHNFIYIMNSYQHLHALERRAIAMLFKNGLSRRQIAQHIHRSPSTVSREIKRNSSSPHDDSWQGAHELSLQRRQSSRLKIKGLLAQLLIHNLKHGFSPDQITMKFSHLGLCTQTIYDFIWRDYSQRGKLWTHLRSCGKGKHCRSYKNKRGSGKARYSRHKDHSIDLRSHAINQRLRYGHWEADLIEARGKQRPLLVLIERKSRFTLSGFLQGKWSEEVARVSQHLLKGFKVLSLTCDNGPEFLDHKLISSSLQCKVYYAHPYKSWQKGAVENVNKLYRQFFPKGSSFSQLSIDEPINASTQINNRPRRSLNSKAPASLLNKLTINP